jgi:hypothetical protein
VEPPPAWPWASLQAAIAATPAGGTLDATGRTFRERVVVNKNITLRGGTIDGTGLGVPLQQGVLNVTSPATLVGVRATGSSGGGISIDNTADVTVSDCEFDNNIQQGYHVSGCQRITFLRCHIHHNNVARTIDPGWEAGGGKVAVSSDVTFDACESDHNGGPGIWADIDVRNWIVRNCLVHDNERGIMFEISDGARIYGNTLAANGRANDGWCWSASILISSSKNAEVYGNVIHALGTGIAVLSQKRGGTWDTVTGNYVHDNDIAMEPPIAGGEWAGLSFAQDWAGTMETGNNREGANRFWFPSPEPSWQRFGGWAGVRLDTLAKLNASALSVAPSRYLTTAEKDALA